MSKRNANIDCWKFIFSVLILLYHCLYLRRGVRYFSGGGIGVEFYFLVSGYLMVNSFDHQKKTGNRARDTFNFIKRKAVPLIPVIWAGGLIGIAVTSLISHSTAKGWIKLFATNIWDFMMINYSGLNWVNTNGPTWYISVMLLSMVILYPIMHKDKELFLTVIAPVVSLFGLGYLYQNVATPLSHTPLIWLGLFYKGMLRGIAEICLGAVCYVFAKKLRECRLTPAGRVFFSLVENLCYVVVLCTACLRKAAKHDFILLLILTVAVSCSFSGQTARYPFPNKISALANFGVYIYLGHFYWAILLGPLFPTIDYWSLFAVYLVCSVITAFLVRFGSKVIVRVWKAGVNLLIASEEPAVPLGGGGVAFLGNEWSRKAFPLFGQGYCCAEYIQGPHAGRVFHAKPVHQRRFVPA